MLKVCKFGGSSLSDAARFSRVRDLIHSDISRRVVVVSAPGKRHAADHKITDLLYLCHAHLRCGVPCWDLWRRICERFLAIRDGCGLKFPLEAELEKIYASLSAQTTADALASRGEYLTARLMAELLGFAFVDSSQWLQFDSGGNVLPEASYALLQSLADGRKIVTPGFYGSLPSGAIHTFSRGGSDVTGALAAAALHADVYENWTDVPGVLAADPNLIQSPVSIPELSYAELQALSQVGMQVLHEEAVAPVRSRQIPMQIRSTAQPEHPGTLIRDRWGEGAPTGVVGLAGRRNLAMLRMEAPELLLEAEGAARLLSRMEQAGLHVFHSACALGTLTALVRCETGADALHAAVETLSRSLSPGRLKLRENLSVLAVLHRGTEGLAGLLAAIQAAGVPIHHLAQCAPCLLLTVNDSQYEAALRAAYDASRS